MNKERVINDIVQGIIDIEILGVVFAKHRQCKTKPILPPADETGFSTPFRLSPNNLTNTATSNNNNFNNNSSSLSPHNINSTTTITSSEIVERGPGYDVFGNATQGKGVPKVSQECICPKCNRSIAATRFAPHLEKCMGMGRAASRAREVSYCEN